MPRTTSTSRRPSNESSSSSGGSSRTSSGSSSSGSSDARSVSSALSAATTTAYNPKVAEIRTLSTGKALYIKRWDGEEETVDDIGELLAYTMAIPGDMMKRKTDPKLYWSAYNSIAQFILSGHIRLSGGLDCFKNLATPRTNVRTVKATRGIFFVPDKNIPAYGSITADASGSSLRKAHIDDVAKTDEHGRCTNAITLLKGTKYLIAGDDIVNISLDVKQPEILICHRGKLRESGFEIPCTIERNDLWLLDSSGMWVGTQPLFGGSDHPLCSGCFQSYSQRKWSTPDICTGEGQCRNAPHQVGANARQLGYSPALAKVECEGCIVGSFERGRHPYGPKEKRTLERVLDSNVKIHDWQHLAEVARLPTHMLVRLFCSLPSLGERLDRKGASFVPWASESGLYLGEFLRLETYDLQFLFVVLEGAVIEIHTGEKIRFDENQDGVIHVKRVTEGFSDRFPEGVGGYVLLGG